MTSNLLSNNSGTIAGAIKYAIDQDSNSNAKKKAREGVRYYNYQHDIVKNRIMYIDGNGVLKEDKHASNVRIPHSFLNELIDQKTQYLLANPVEAVTDDDKLQGYLSEYYTPAFQLFLQELIEGGSQKGFEYAYARTTEQDKLVFQVADSLKVIPIYDDNNQVQRVLRHYSQTVTENGKDKVLNYAQVFDSEQVWSFVAVDKGQYTLDTSVTNNPAPHVMAFDEVTGDMLGRSYGTLPFYRYANNKAERTDLEPIKALIDDYDLMDAFLSNNLQDFTEAIYVVKGYQGDNLETLRDNLRSKKTVGIGDNGDVDVKTIEIPVEARRTKLEIDRQNIYKFGLGYDSSQVGDGNVTNVVIKGRYTLLNMKANKTETRLRAFLDWANTLIIEDINRRYNTAFTLSQLTINITREMLLNENDLINNAKTEADTRSVEMQTLLAAAPRLDNDTVLKQICDMYELDFDTVKQALEEQDYKQLPDPEQQQGGVNDGTDGQD